MVDTCVRHAQMETSRLLAYLLAFPLLASHRPYLRSVLKDGYGSGEPKENRVG
jgi:hypothetical protein